MRASAKENILKKIRQALSQSTPIPFPQSEGSHPVFQPATQDPEIEFAEQFARLQGKFVFCVDHQELDAQLNTLVSARSWNKLYCREEKLITTLKDHLFDGFTEIQLAECDTALPTCVFVIANTL